jgi:hypothetical protein
MVGTRRLELLTSTVSTPELEVNRCTYKALVATKSPVGYGSSAYCDLNVPTQMPIVPILHNQSALAAAGRNDCHLRSSSRADLVHRLRLPISSNEATICGGQVAYFHSGTGTHGQGSACVINTLPDRVQSHNRQAAAEYSSSSLNECPRCWVLSGRKRQRTSFSRLFVQDTARCNLEISTLGTELAG